MLLQSGKIGVLFCLIFPALALCALLLQRVVSKLRQELDLVKYKQERGEIEQAPPPPPPEELVEGYTLMTDDDYNAILDKLKKELKDDPLRGNV